MVLVGVLRHNVTSLMNNPPKKSTLAKIREQCVVSQLFLNLSPALQSEADSITFKSLCRRILSRSQSLQANHFNLPPTSFLARRAYLIDALGAGKYLAEPLDADGKGAKAAKNPLSDPAGMEGMMEGMKKSMVMMVPQTVIMGWINFFFSGFVLSEWESCRLQELD